MMRITVNIDENKLDEVLKWTGHRKKSPAVAQAIDDYLKQKKREAFVTKVLEGKSDYRTSNDDLEAMSAIERE